MNKLFKKIKKYIPITIISLTLIIALSVISICKYIDTHSVNKDFASIDLTDVNNLMIVAHPDDESLWGGAHLLKDNYLVVCVTCGTNQTRVNEFVKIMNTTNDKYIMLGYPDKTNGERDNWDNHRANISKDLESIINLKEWDVIVTHNPDGEYGHQHHKMTSAITSDIVKTDNLYYFGIYHSKKTITEYYDEMSPINDKYLSDKRRLVSIYKSQDFVQTMFDHMYSYENWINRADWSND